MHRMQNSIILYNVNRYYVNTQLPSNRLILYSYPDDFNYVCVPEVIKRGLESSAPNKKWEMNVQKILVYGF